MSYAPATLTDLSRYWQGKGGTTLGIVGNTAHTKGYHLGKDRIYDGASGPGLGDKDYSVQLPRDKAGLSNAASAIDLGRLNGTFTGLRKFSRWLVAQCQAGAAGSRDIREVIYSPDGVYVKRWSAVDGKVITSLKRNADGSITVINPGNGDASHLRHTHISYYRDSVARDKRALFAPFFAAALPDTSTEDDLPVIATYLPGHVATVKRTANIRSAPKIEGSTLIRTLAAKEQWVITGWVKGEVDPESGSDQWVCRWAGGRWEYTAKVNLSAGPTAPTDPTPFSQADIDAAVAPITAQVAALNTKITNAKAALG